MIIIEPWQTAITLFRDDGEAWVYRNVASARSELGLSFIRSNVGRHFVEFSHNDKRWGDVDGVMRVVSSEQVYIEHRYVMRDDAGAPVTADAFELPRKRRRYYGRGNFSTWNGEGAVPGSGHGRRYRQWRQIRTMQEARMNQASVEAEMDEEPKARPSRTRPNLPHAWDDISRDPGRNWKDFRLTRYRG